MRCAPSAKRLNNTVSLSRLSDGLPGNPRRLCNLLAYLPDGGYQSISGSGNELDASVRLLRGVGNRFRPLFRLLGSGQHRYCGRLKLSGFRTQRAGFGTECLLEPVDQTIQIINALISRRLLG